MGFPISARNIIMEQHEQECHYLQDVLLGLEQNFADSEYEARLDFQSTRDDIKNKVQRGTYSLSSDRLACQRFPCMTSFTTNGHCHLLVLLLLLCCQLGYFSPANCRYKWLQRDSTPTHGALGHSTVSVLRMPPSAL